MTADEIIERYDGELADVERELLRIFDSPAPLIPLVGRHIAGSGGKRIRPLFLLLAADLCGYKGPDRPLLGAMIEAIHTASLLHDDVVDEAETRRGKQAAHSIWGNQVVILVGDFLYSNALRMSVSREKPKIVGALSEATTRMTEAELLQLYKTGDPSITLDEYFTIISGKTGVLISAACKVAAAAAGISDEQEQALGIFGLKTGIAFQLADDILDYVALQQDLGKKLGKDLEEGKITMPLIQLLKAATPEEQDEVKRIIDEMINGDTGLTSEKRSAHLERIISLFEKYNAIEASFAIARGLVEAAKKELEIFPATAEREALMTMADFTLQRKK